MPAAGAAEEHIGREVNRHLHSGAQREDCRMMLPVEAATGALKRRSGQRIGVGVQLSSQRQKAWEGHPRVLGIWMPRRQRAC